MTIRKIERQYGEHRAYMPFALVFLFATADQAWFGDSSWLWVALAGMFCVVNAFGLWLCRAGIRDYDAACDLADKIRALGRLP